MRRYNRKYSEVVYERFKNILINGIRDLDVNIESKLHIVASDKEYEIAEELSNREYVEENLLEEYYFSGIEQCEYRDKIYFILDNSVFNEYNELYSIIILELNRESYNKSNVKFTLKNIIEKILILFKNALEIDFMEYSKYLSNDIENEIEYIHENIEEYIDYYKKTENYRKSYRDIIKYECQSYIEDIIHNEKKIHIRFDDIDIISRATYEGIYSHGTIVLAEYNKEDIDIKFADTYEFKKHKNTRKLLEMCNEEYGLVTDGETVFGLKKIKGKNYLGIEFNGKNKYRIIQNKQTIIEFEYGYPINNKNVYNREHILNQIEKKITNKDKANQVADLIQSIKDVGRGGMLVISASPNKDIENLKSQSILIEPIKIDKNIIKSICTIDGSILVDEDLNCYAIGVILDGNADKRLGTSERGARYNAAIKYIAKDEVNDCIAIVISEDGMVELIDKELIDEKYLSKDGTCTV